MDVLHTDSPPDASWSSVNLAEAVPGVMTPLTASIWVPASELGLRAPFRAMGVVDKGRAGIPDDPLDRITGAFYGRMAVRVDFLCEMGDLIPGQSGDALARDFFGFVPDDFVSHPSNRRMPAIVMRYPRTLMGVARTIERRRTETDAWWRKAIAHVDSLSLAETRGLLTDAVCRFTGALEEQAVVSACAIQLVHEQITALAEAAGVDVTDLLRGHGSHEESAVLADMWSVSRDVLSLDEFLRRHGYHCAGEGETAAVSWREDPAPVTRLVDQFAARPESESPFMRAEQLAGSAAEAERLLHADGPAGRLRTSITLRLARRFIPLRGVGKVSYLQCLDVVRACARRIGAEAVVAGTLDDVDAAFYFTATELASPLSVDAGRIAVQRRARRAEFQGMTVPPTWRGNPPAELVVVTDADRGTVDRGTGDRFVGVGACAGVVEGRAVVVTDPGESDLDDGDILIAHTTDPSWVSLMFLSAGLVVDIGGLMSHAAVVARELGVPCIMNTGRGTSLIETGDIIRIDGGTGCVEILSRKASAVS